MTVLKVMSTMIVAGATGILISTEGHWENAQMTVLKTATMTARMTVLRMTATKTAQMTVSKKPMIPIEDNPTKGIDNVIG